MVMMIMKILLFNEKSLSININWGVAFELCLCNGDDNADTCNLANEMIHPQMKNMGNYLWSSLDQQKNLTKRSSATHFQAYLEELKAACFHEQQ